MAKRKATTPTAPERLRAWIEEKFGGEASEAREGEYETDIPAPWDRNHESRSVAARMLDGSYVGWTYWYGGGKHAEPEAIPWIEDAYDVVMREETVVVKKFTKAK